MKVFTEKSDTLPKPKNDALLPTTLGLVAFIYPFLLHCTGRFLPSNIINYGHLSQRLLNVFSSLQFLAEGLALIGTH